MARGLRAPDNGHDRARVMEHISVVLGIVAPSIVALEAAACGIPVVASAVGGLLNLVEHERTGYVVKNRDVETFAGYTRRLLDDSILSLSMGTNAAHRARNYSWASTAASVIGVYEALEARQLVACS